MFATFTLTGFSFLKNTQFNFPRRSKMALGDLEIIFCYELQHLFFMVALKKGQKRVKKCKPLWHSLVGGVFM